MKPDYDLIWLYRRKDDKLKIRNYDSLKRMVSAIREVDHKNIVYHLDQVKPKTPHLVFNEGSPNFNHFKLTHNGLLISNYRDVNSVWESYPIDDDILEKISLRRNEKYIQPVTQYADSGYDLFFMQLSMTTDYDCMVDALAYAKTNKRKTVFKSHPAAGDTSSVNAWNHFVQKGLTSEYSIFVDDQSVDSLIKNADRVYSADSAANFKAMLAGKIVATYRPTDMSSVIPLINSATDLDNAVKTPIDKIKRFLSWYENCLCIDLDSEDHSDRIRHIIQSFENELTFEETFRCR